MLQRLKGVAAGEETCWCCCWLLAERTFGFMPSLVF